MAHEGLEPLLWLGPSKYFVKSLVAVYEGMPEKRKKILIIISFLVNISQFTQLSYLKKYIEIADL